MKNKYFIYLTFFLIFLSSCSSFKKGIGIEKDTPDEFLIKKIDKIEMPPNYELIPPGTKVATKKEKIIKKNEFKKILDNQLTTKESTTSNDINKSTSDSLEKSILDQIKK
jgi:hypothetical protein